MFIKLRIGQLPSPTVGSIQVELYDGDNKVRDLDMNSTVIDLLQELRIEVKEGSLCLPNTNDGTNKDKVRSH